MNKLLRTLVVLSSVALTSALFGASVELGDLSSSNMVRTTVEGSYDGSFEIVNNETNQVVAYVSYYKTFYGASSWWYSDFTCYGGSDVSGVVVTASGQCAEITGLPSGNYRIVYSSVSYGSAGATVNGLVGWSQPTVHFEPYGTSSWEWLDFYTEVE